MCKIDSQWEFAVCLRKLKQGLCINLEVWDGEGRWEGGLRGRGHMYIYGWFMLKFDRKQQNSVKRLSFNLKVNKLIIICVYIYNWITLLYTWNIVSQLYFNKIHILRKKRIKLLQIYHKRKVMLCYANLTGLTQVCLSHQVPCRLGLPSVSKNPTIWPHKLTCQEKTGSSTLAFNHHLV